MAGKLLYTETLWVLLSSFIAVHRLHCLAVLMILFTFIFLILSSTFVSMCVHYIKDSCVLPLCFACGYFFFFQWSSCFCVWGVIMSPPVDFCCLFIYWLPLYQLAFHKQGECSFQRSSTCRSPCWSWSFRWLSPCMTLWRLFDWQGIFSSHFSHCHCTVFFRIHARLIIVEFLHLPVYIF